MFGFDALRLACPHEEVQIGLLKFHEKLHKNDGCILNKRAQKSGAKWYHISLGEQILSLPVMTFYTAFLWSDNSHYTFFLNLLRSTKIKIFLSFYHLWNETNCWSSEHHKIQTADVVIFGVFFPSAVTWRTGAAVVWTGDEIIINGTAVMMHHYMHAGGRGFNLVCYRERCDCTLTRLLCLS